MTEWDKDGASRAPQGAPGERDWRGGRDWRAEGAPTAPRSTAPQYGSAPADARAYRDDPRAIRGDQGPRGPREERPAPYEQGGQTFEPGGAAARGYGQGGDTSFGQMASGSSDSGLGGYGGANVGGFGQPNLNSQWGQGGFAPLNQGLDYGQDGGRFGPAGYDGGTFGSAPRPSDFQRRPGAPGPHPAAHDDHHVHYRSWRDTQLANHDRDYSRWRDEQARRYDEEYGSWRNERHTAFSREFEGWRAGRGGQAGAQPPVTPSTSAPTTAASGTSATVNPSERALTGEGGFAHGANPTLANIADGHAGQHHHHDPKAEDHDKTPKS